MMMKCISDVSVIMLLIVCGAVFSQLSELPPLLNQIYTTFGEVWTLFENDARQNDTMDSVGTLRVASILLCQRDLPLNDTDDRRSQYFDRLRPVSEQSSFDGSDNSSAYVYDNSTSELDMSCFVACSQ